MIKMVVDLTKSLDDLVRELGRGRKGFEEVDSLNARTLSKVPYGRFKKNYDDIRARRLQGKNIAGYMWLIASLDKLLGKNYNLDSDKGYFKLFENPLLELIENAHRWGNKEDHDKKLEIEVFYSPNGYLIIVRDEGKGFDVKGVLAKKKRRRKYWQDGGCGFKLIGADKVNIYSYNKKGNEAYMLCLRENGKA